MGRNVKIETLESERKIRKEWKMEQQLREIMNYYKGQPNPQEQENIVELLREVQELMGCIPNDVQETIAAEFDVKTSMIATIIKLYPSLKASNYKHRIIACTGARCEAKDGAMILNAIRKTLGIEKDGLSKDGQFYLTTQNCLKRCKTSPNFYVDGTLYSNAKECDVESILSQYQSE